MSETIKGKTSGWKTLDVVVGVVAAAMVLYHMLFAQYLLWSPKLHMNAHLGFSLVLAYLLGMQSKHKRWPLTLGLALLSIAPILYVHIFYDQLELRAEFNTPIDLAMGLILMILCLEATRREYGLLLPVMAVLSVMYMIFGPYLPRPFTTVPVSWEQAISRSSIGISGIYGIVLSVSANYIFLFMYFAALIQVTGAVDFFLEIGKFAGRRFRAGPAVSAVVASGLFGAICGQTGANAMVTGSFTVPLMKKVGYTPEQAGGIEAAASTAGPLVPPVMGVAAFVMSGYTGIPYFKICAAAALPAVLYVVCCGSYVVFQGEKMQVTPLHEKGNARLFLARLPLFLIPLLVIVVLLIKGYTLPFIGFWACISLLVISLFNKNTRPSLRGLVSGFTAGARMGSQIGAMAGTLGIIITGLTVSGLVIKLPGLITGICGDNLLLALTLIGAISVVLGMGVPSVVVYMLVGIICAPVLVKMGVSLLQSHLAIFFFSTYSFITPPVAIAVLFASQLAGSDYVKTGIEACKVAFAAFFLPFLIVYTPALVLNFSNPLVSVLGMIGSFAMLVGLTVGFVGFYLTELNLFERIVAFGFSGILFVYFSFYQQNAVLFALGIATLAALTVWQWRRKRLHAMMKRLEISSGTAPK